MSFTNLQSFIKHLDEIGDLKRFRLSVDPLIEAAAIINKEGQVKAESKALLFNNVKGSSLTLAANLFGSEKRIAAALGVPCLETLSEQLRRDLQQCTEKDYGPALAEVIHRHDIETVKIDQERRFAIVTYDRGLELLPALKTWPEDGGRYLTLAQTFTRYPDSDKQNCGMYRLQILDEQTALIRCHPGSGAAAHIQAWHARGLDMPIAVVLGGPPALTLCAGISLPGEVSEYDFASYLAGEAITVVKCLNSTLVVPADAEIVIEGEVVAGEERIEGPFGNHTGYYSPAAPAPVVRIKSVHMRERAVYPCTVVGPPPTENMSLAHAVERLMLPLLQHKNPWLIDIHMPLAGIYHRGAIVSVATGELSAREISDALRQSPLLRNSRLIVLLDSDNDLRNAEQVYWRVINSDDWRRSVLIDENNMTIDARTSSERMRIQI